MGDVESAFARGFWCGFGGVPKRRKVPLTSLRLYPTFFLDAEAARGTFLSDIWSEVVTSKLQMLGSYVYVVDARDV